MLGALGVVFGDIGTSPLYVVQTVFSIHQGAVAPTASAVFGVASLVFWSITLIVSVKYVVFVMREDNDGEGGVMALAAFIRRILGGANARSLGFVTGLGVLGAALFFGDSVITPRSRCCLLSKGSRSHRLACPTWYCRSRSPF